MVVQQISVLILLLPCALYNIVVDGLFTCVPVNTPWTGMCKSECEDWQPGLVLLFDCNATTLVQRSLSGGGEDITVTFTSSGIRNVSPRAFSGYTVDSLVFTNSFKKFEDEAFADLTVYKLVIKDNSNLTSLPSGVFRGIKGLKDLSLYNNDLQSLPASIFHELTGLEVLELAYNNLKSLPAGIFHELGDLTILYIHGNSIGCFRWDLFQPLQSLQELYMKQEVDIEGLCPRTFKGLVPQVMDYNVKITRCIYECGTSLNGKDSNNACDCDSYEGCLDCSTGDPVQPPTPTTIGGVPAVKAAATGRIMLIVSPVMVLIRLLDF